MTQKEIDWKNIAIELGQRVNFAVQHLSGTNKFLLNQETMEMTHWHDYFAEGLEMLPDVKIDREILATMRLPKRQGDKARKEIKERRAKEIGDNQ